MPPTDSKAPPNLGDGFLENPSGPPPKRGDGLGNSLNFTLFVEAAGPRLELLRRPLGPLEPEAWRSPAQEPTPGGHHLTERRATQQHGVLGTWKNCPPCPAAPHPWTLDNRPTDPPGPSITPKGPPRSSLNTAAAHAVIGPTLGHLSPPGPPACRVLLFFDTALLLRGAASASERVELALRNTRGLHLGTCLPGLPLARATSTEEECCVSCRHVPL